MAVVSVDEVAAYMGGFRLTPDQRTGTALIIEGVQAELERYINRAIETRQIREAVVGDGRGYLNLSQSPVHSINRITYYTHEQEPDVLGEIPMGDPAPFNGPSYDVVPANNGRDLIAAGGVYLGMIGIDGAYVVEYIGGGGDFIAPYLPAIKIAILRVVAREVQLMYDNTMSLRQESAATPTDPIPVTKKGWQQAELVEFDRIRRRVVAT